MAKKKSKNTIERIALAIGLPVSAVILIIIFFVIVIGRIKGWW